MSIVPFDDLKIGEVYVSPGGFATTKKLETVVWGYDRIKIIKKFKEGALPKILVQTPWNTECELPGDYPLSSTTETRIKCEFKILGEHIERSTIPFDDAVKQGICTEQDAITQPQDTTHATVTTSRARAKRTSTNEFIQSIIDFFEEPHTLTEAAAQLSCVYQKVRYAIQSIKESGYNSIEYNIIQGKNSVGKITIQIKKV